MPRYFSTLYTGIITLILGVFSISRNPFSLICTTQSRGFFRNSAANGSIVPIIIHHSASGVGEISEFSEEFSEEPESEEDGAEELELEEEEDEEDEEEEGGEELEELLLPEEPPETGTPLLSSFVPGP